MAGYNNQPNRGNYNNSNNRSSYGQANKDGTSNNAGIRKSEALFEKLMKPSKSGKSVATFAVGDKDIVLPKNTRVVITALTEKQTAGLSKAREKNGYTGPVPTHKLSVFPITDNK